MREHPILFSPPMVRAILEGRKTQTRRAISHFDGSTYALDPANVRWQFNEGSDDQRVDWRNKWYAYPKNSGSSAFPVYGLRCPFGQPRDRLWVRETWAPCGKQSYPAADMVRHGDDGAIHRATWDRSPPSRWRPSIFMPRWASRITLEVTGVRVERLQEISEEDALAEGVIRRPIEGEPDLSLPARDGYQWLWDTLNAKRGFGWEKNPWVWVVEFKRV